ncbi:MAG: diguanylate cyclase [Desulfotomaculaceae bacterium]|nr:diguanylate cyclase [Desulfotomaculaceae bacterium]
MSDKSKGRGYCEGNLLYVNQNAFNFFSGTQEEFDKGIVVFDYIVPEDRYIIRENMIKILNGEYLGGQDYTARRKDGSRFPITIHSKAIIEEGRPVGFRGIIVDISERKKLEEQLITLSLHDSLTGLYNRAYFEQEMKRLSKKFCLAVCDVDGLKLVNDTLGHDVGDKILITTAQLVKRSLREKGV